MLRTIFFTLLLFSSLTVFPSAGDSVGVERVNNQIFILHKIEQGETLFSLSRKYGTSVSDIKSANPSMEVLKIGEILKIPMPEAKDPDATLHKVASSETLYSISRKYGVSVEDIRKWNELNDSGISVGQELKIFAAAQSSTPDTPEIPVPPAVDTAGKKTHTVASGETLYSISRSYEVSVEDIRKWNKLSDNSLSLGQVLIVGAASTQTETAQTEAVENTSTQTENTVTEEAVTVIPATPPATETTKEDPSFDKIVQNGLAEVIEGTENTRKYLALHKTAEVGTIMQVKNEMNGLSVFVRVRGKLPDTPENEMLILKLSDKAYKKLGAVDRRFRVELVYSP